MDSLNLQLAEIVESIECAELKPSVTSSGEVILAGYLKPEDRKRVERELARLPGVTAVCSRPRRSRGLIAICAGYWDLTNRPTASGGNGLAMATPAASGFETSGAGVRLASPIPSGLALSWIGSITTLLPFFQTITNM